MMEDRPAGFTPSTISRCLRWLVPLVLIGVPSLARADWPPITTAELAETTPRIDPEAGAEILSKEVTIKPSHQDIYLRVKLYNQAGVEAFSKIDLIEQETFQQVSQIKARTIKPDGSVLDLDPKDIYKREVSSFTLTSLLSAGSGTKIRYNARSFAPPGLEPGCIVEYSYRINKGYVPLLEFQSEHPTRRVRFKVSPPSNYATMLPDVNRGSIMRAIQAKQIQVTSACFNYPQQPLKRDKDGDFIFEASNLPAAKNEPFQPPVINTRACALLFPMLDKLKSPQEEWIAYSKIQHDDFTDNTFPTGSIKNAVKALLVQGDTDEEKLRKIDNFCRTQITNLSLPKNKLSKKEAADFIEARFPGDTFKEKRGFRTEIRDLFAAMARAAGFDVRYLLTNNRGGMLYSSVLPPMVVLSRAGIAVKVGEQWRFFDPGDAYIPFGLLAWRRNYTTGMISDPKGAIPAISTGGPAEGATAQIRSGVFTLDESGTLEGDVTTTWTGYLATRTYILTEDNDNAAWTKFVRSDYETCLPQAEVSNVVVEPSAETYGPVKIRYHLNVPNFADKAGGRLFLQPSVFEKGRPAFFVAEKRTTDIMFPFKSNLYDDIQITLPADYKLEEPNAPQAFDGGDLASYEMRISYRPDRNTINCQRTFKLKGIAFPKQAYPDIKMVFDHIRKRDDHTFSLKYARAQPASSATSSTPPEPVVANPAP